MRENLETLILSVESGNVVLQVQNGLQVGLHAQKQIGVDLDQVQELTDELAKNLYDIDEATNIMGGSLNPNNEPSDQELLSELAELKLEIERSDENTKNEIPSLLAEKQLEENSELEKLKDIKALPEAPTMKPLPNAPSYKPNLSKEDDVDDELKRLALDM